MKTIENMKTYSVNIDNAILTGNALQILNYMKASRFSQEPVDLNQFMKEICQNVWKLFLIGVSFNENATIPEKCEELLDQLIHHRLIRTKPDSVK
jgi:hypothetical protein